MMRERTVTWEDPANLWDEASALTGVERLQMVVDGKLPAPPMARLMDIRIVEVSNGRAVFAGTPAEFHYNPIGVVHGGYGATILDSAMGCAVHSTLKAGDIYTTLELKINFLRPLTSATGPVRGIANVIHAGRTTALAEGRLEDAGGRLYAYASSTCLIRRKDEGR